MRKILFLPILFSLLLTCCNNKKDISDVSSDESIIDFDSPLIFSELFIGTMAQNRAVEIANISSNEVDLTNYTLNIYRNGGGSNIPSETISLNGKIKSNETYVICYSLSNDSIKQKAQLVSDDFLTDGTFPMSIKYKDIICDTFGAIGYSYDIGSYTDIVRKKEYFIPRETYQAYDWVRYPINDMTHLGNLDVVSENTLIEGPKLCQDDFDKPYCVDASKGSGGLIPIQLSSTIDGDTSKFNFGNSLKKYGISGVQSLRYYGVNTPEIAHYGSDADPYGNEARDFTNSILRKSKKILAQSVNGYSLTEVYGRVLAYVWVSYVDNPKPEDYILLNHLIVVNGFSNPAFIDRTASFNNLMTYQGVSYIEYLYDAQHFSILYKLNIHSGE